MWCGLKTGVTKVDVGYYINDFFINEDDRTFYAHFYLRQSWRDTRLLSQYGLTTPGTEQLRIDAWDEVWTPDIFFRNAREVHEFDVPTEQKLMRLNSTGHVWFVDNLAGTFSCPMLGRKSDSFACGILLESYGYTMDTMYFDWLSHGVELDPSIYEPNLVEKKQMDCSQNYTAGTFPCLEARFEFRRD